MFYFLSSTHRYHNLQERINILALYITFSLVLLCTSSASNSIENGNLVVGIMILKFRGHNNAYYNRIMGTYLRTFCASVLEKHNKPRFFITQHTHTIYLNENH